MSHYVPLSHFLTEGITLIYGALHQGGVSLDLNNGNLTLNGVEISYIGENIEGKLQEIDSLIEEYKLEEDNPHEDLILILEDIKTFLTTIQDRILWLQ